MPASRADQLLNCAKWNEQMSANLAKRDPAASERMAKQAANLYRQSCMELDPNLGARHDQNTNPDCR